MSIRNHIQRLVLKYQVMLTRKGPHRFVFRQLQKVNDINVLSSALQTEPFRDSLELVELPLNQFKRYLVLAPHQDDETIGAGGLMARLAQQGAETHVLFISDGGQVIQPGLSEEDVVKLRREEATAALKLVGANMHELHMRDLEPQPTLQHVRELSRMIKEISPDVILLPWLFDAPIKHRMACHLLYLAAQYEPALAKEVWGYQVHNALFANGYVNITGVIETKREMIGSYKSQIDNVQAYDHTSVGLAAWNSRVMKPDDNGPRERYAELFHTTSMEAFIEAVAQFYLPSPYTTYKGKSSMIEAMKDLQAAVDADLRA